ncbi:BDN_1c_G0037060.mRNA.1.CDS.1 [Saccharomyces cerevisiae]|nr:BDN_1c_G0037060.mRNA.1.CDS.1 [Saccharomyces cerevisiae]CAI7218668.1 BDN_1c_G0037060.mRNA.1.CDS.1 [Saccharomyces cerevisiae]
MEGLKKKIFGVCLKNDLAQTRNETKGIHYGLMTLETSKQLEEFLHLLVIKREVIQNFELLFHIINVAVKITDSNLPSDDIWHFILKLRFSSEINIDEDSKVLNYLLETGIAMENPVSWKCLAVISSILSSVPQSKKIITNLIETEHAKKIGQLFDNIQDLQQGNFLVEILSNCFKKSASNSKKVEKIPQLWQSRSKNKFFFENEFYPFSSKNGSLQTCQFLCKNFMSTLSFTGILRQVSYSGSETLKNLRIFKKKDDENSYFIQCIYNKIYLWLDEKAPLEFERKKIRITKNLKNKIQIKLRQPFHECVRTTADKTAPLFNKTRGFQLEFEDEKLGETFFHNVNNIPKISEVQNFLVLGYIEEEPENEGEEEEQTRRADEQKEDEEEESLDELSTPMVYPIKSSISHNHNEKVQLVTPDRSVSIRSDEWDLKSNTEDEEGNVLTDLKISSTKETKRQTDYVHIDSEDQSPVVSAQMRKMRRESTKTLEILRQEFKDKDVQNKEDQSEQIQNPFVHTSSLVVGKYCLVNPKEKPNVDQTVVGITELKSNSSIKKRDINILDTIFGQPPSKKQKQFHKKEKKKQQKKLTNFKPIIDVPSQDKRNLRSNAPTKPKSIKVSKLRTDKKVTGEKSSPETTAEKVDDQTVRSNDEQAVSRATKEKRFPDVNEGKEITNNDAKVSLESKKNNETFVDSSVVEKHTPPDKDCNNCNITDILESTTVIDLHSPHGLSAPGQNTFTNKLQEQIYSSINHFSNELVRKISIINQELNKKILKELSEKYQKLFAELQDNFQNDTNEMLKLMGEIKDMMNLPEDQLVHAIRTRKFDNNKR